MELAPKPAAALKLAPPKPSARDGDLRHAADHVPLPPRRPTLAASLPAPRGEAPKAVAAAPPAAVLAEAPAIPSAEPILLPAAPAPMVVTPVAPSAPAAGTVDLPAEPVAPQAVVAAVTPVAPVSAPVRITPAAGGTPWSIRLGFYAASALILAWGFRSRRDAGAKAASRPHGRPVPAEAA